MSKLWKFYWDCGRMGSLEGLFVESQQRIDAIIGQEIYFGEVLGKHSDISGTISAEDFEAIDIGEEAIDKIVAVTGATVSGYNPFEYWDEETTE